MALCSRVLRAFGACPGILAPLSYRAWTYSQETSLRGKGLYFAEARAFRSEHVPFGAYTLHNKTQKNTDPVLVSSGMLSAEPYFKWSVYAATPRGTCD